MTHERRPGRDDALGERRERLLEQQAALASLTHSPVFHGDDLEETIRHVNGMAARYRARQPVALYTSAKRAPQHVERLAAVDRMHAAFAARVGAYLGGFQMKKLRQWLEQIDRR